MPRDHFLCQIKLPSKLFRAIEKSRHPGVRSRSELFSRPCALDQVFNALGEVERLARGNNQPFAEIFNNLRYHENICSYHGQFEGHCFENDSWKRLLKTSTDKNIGKAIEIEDFVALFNQARICPLDRFEPGLQQI